MRTYKIMVVVGLLLLVGLTGCRQSAQSDSTAPAVDISLEMDPATPTAGEVTLIVILKDASGGPVNDARVEVKGDMSHAGMQPVLGEASAGEDGHYEIPFQWTMGGDWIVTVSVTLADGQTASKTFDVSVAGDV